MREALLEQSGMDTLTFYDGWDDAIIGLAHRCSGDPVVAYDKAKIIEGLMRDMPYEDAVEYFAFNIGGMYVGPGTPVFIELPETA